MSGRSSRADAAVVLLAVGAAAACKDAGEVSGGRRGEPLRVAAAADLALAFKEVGDAFERESGRSVTFSFGSTGLLAKQIAEGAPYDVFAAANVSFVDDVARDGACLPETKALYATGRIVLWAKDPWTLPARIDDLAEPRFAKVALANPEHAPYGRAAREALTRAGVWSSVQPRAVYGENVQQTMMFASSGNADIAIVALSLAIASPGNYVAIDPSLHEPLDQGLVVCKGGSNGPRLNEARAFVAFVGSPPGRTIMKKYGFLLPGESLPAK